MKKILLLISVASFTFANINLYTCGATVNGNEVTFDMCMDASEAIGGFQFQFDGGNSGFELSSASGGIAAASGFTVSVGGNTILGFSFTGGTIDAGDGQVLTQLIGTFANTNETTIGPVPESSVFSSPEAVAIPSTEESSQWDGGSLLDGDHPAEYSLMEAYPNPFNPTTTIEYNIMTAGNVSIVVYDLMGREIKELVNDYKSPISNGTYSVIWDGTNNSGNAVSSGMYIYRMISNDFIKTHRLTLMK